MRRGWLWDVPSVKCQTLIILSFMVLLVGQVKATETVTYYYTNEQGTPLATTDGAGNVVSTVDYRPYGKQALGGAQQGPDLRGT